MWRDRKGSDTARAEQEHLELFGLYLNEIERQHQGQKARIARVDVGAGLLVASALFLLSAAHAIGPAELRVACAGYAALALLLAVFSVTPAQSREVDLLEARVEILNTGDRIAAVNWLGREGRLRVEARDRQLNRRFRILRVGYVALSLAASTYFISVVASA